MRLLDIRLAAAAIIIAGSALRIALFFSPHALWVDEVALALNFVDRSFSQLLAPLDSDQHAPLGFLMLVELSTRLLGHTEFAFRLIPLLAGIAFPVLMWGIARQLSGIASIAVLLLAAFSPTLVRYSVELKPYAVDPLAMLVIMALYWTPSQSRPWADSGGPRREVGAALVSSALVLSSFPAIFCLCGLLAARTVQAIQRGDRAGAVHALAMATPWLLTFGVYSLGLLISTSTNTYLQTFWAPDFLAWPLSPAAIRKDMDLLLRAIGPNVGLQQQAGALLLACAIAHSLRADRHRGLSSLLAIVGVTAVASLLHRWPFNVRLLLFLAPVALLVAGWAVELISEGRRHVVGALVTAALLVGPLPETNDLADTVGVPTGARAIAQTLAGRIEPGDVVYAYYLAYYELKFYQDLGAVPRWPIIEGEDLIRQDFTAVERQLDRLDPHARVWVLFANVRRSGYDERQAILDYLSRRRVELGTFSNAVSLFGPVTK